MKSVVLDVSAVVAWVLIDERSHLGDQLAKRVGRFGATVPAIWHTELLNVLRTAMVRGRVSESVVQDWLKRLRRMPIVTEEFSWERGLEALSLSRTYGLSVYDATYLELARRRVEPLATKDDLLVQAAGKAGVEIVFV